MRRGGPGRPGRVLREGVHLDSMCRVEAWVVGTVLISNVGMYGGYTKVRGIREGYRRHLVEDGSIVFTRVGARGSATRNSFPPSAVADDRDLTCFGPRHITFGKLPPTLPSHDDRNTFPYNSKIRGLVASTEVRIRNAQGVHEETSTSYITVERVAVDQGSRSGETMDKGDRREG